MIPRAFPMTRPPTGAAYTRVVIAKALARSTVAGSSLRLAAGLLAPGISPEQLTARLGDIIGTIVAEAAGERRRSRENTMKVWNRLKSVFEGAEPHLPPKLDASSEAALSTSIRILPLGSRGWITMQEARSLFSPFRDQYAFGDTDEQGKAKIALFAAQRGHHSDIDFMPVEDRVYFTRTAGG
jgi:hypothetical protein